MKPHLHLLIFSIYFVSANSYTRRNQQHLQENRRSGNSVKDQWVNEKILRTRSHKKRLRASADYQNAVEREDQKDVEKAREKALILTKAKGKEAELNLLPIQATGDTGNRKMRYHMDPVFDILRSGDFRRDNDWKTEETISESSSRELGDFKEQFKELWMEKKFEALNSTMPNGDQINMAAARPWGTKCGDPTQHDMPWGSCMLPMECEPEYRVYRGDKFCGRTSFVCCAIEANTYDLYQGFDVSFNDKSLSTDTEEIRNREDDKNKGKKEFQKDKKKRKDSRMKRKKKIRKTIKNIMKEINKILNKISQNSSRLRKTRSRQMKKLIKRLKKEYKQNRIAVKDLHEEYMLKIDAALMQKIKQIKDMNSNFMNNQTFANIVVNGTMTKEGARMLVEAYPELGKYIRLRRSDDKESPDYLDYDVEYGFLYY